MRPPLQREPHESGAIARSTGHLSMSNYTNYGFRLHTVEMAGNPAVLFGGVTDLSHILNTELASPETGGAFRESQSVVAQSPEIPVTSQSLGAILANIGLTGKCITSDGSHLGFTAYMQKHEPCEVGARSAAANASVRFPFGHLFLDTVEAGAVGSNATAAMRAHAISPTGDAKPWVEAYNVVLPSGLVKTQYALGKPTILGSVVDKIVSQSINYSPSFQKPADAATIWPTEIDPSDFDFAITIVARAPELLSSIGSSGFQHTDDDTKLRFVQRATNAAEQATASNGAFVDFTELEHIEGDARGLVYVGEHYNSSGRATGLTQIMIAGIEDGTAPLVWDTAAVYDPS